MRQGPLRGRVTAMELWGTHTLHISACPARAAAAGESAMRNLDATPEATPAAPAARRACAGAHIWAVGGGKGGVGKSVIASNLAVALAANGARCIVIDADLGGANAHTLLGVRRPTRTLSHFLSGEAARLEEVLFPTSVPSVKLVSGARALLDVANLNHMKKLRFIRQLRLLPARHVVLDLGAGSSFNVLDFFLAADTRITVVSPEPTAIENAYHFVKAAFFRALRGASQRSSVRTILEAVLADARRRATTPRELIEYAARQSPEAGAILREQAEAFAPWLIVNQIARPEHWHIGPEMASACRTHLGSELHFAGGIERDERVPECVDRQLPVLQIYPGSSFASGLRSVCERVCQGAAHAEPPRTALRHVEQAKRAVLHGLVEASPAMLASSAPPPPRPRRVLPPLDTQNPGRYLRHCREAQGLPIDILSERTRIRRLDRIECELFDELPPEPYVRGYVLEYARALGIGEIDALVESYLVRYRSAARPS
jgi:flagellar biosynthesis protein FlhG